MRYCPNCKKNVETVKNFNWFIFLMGVLLLGIGAGLYILYYLIFKKSICAECKGEI